MRLYRVDDEVRVALSRRLRDWAKAGLLSSDQAHGLQGEVATELKRSGLMLRLGLALFTIIAGIATIGLVFLAINMNSEVAIAIACLLLATGAFMGATVFARDFKWYRHGIEEALAVGAVVLAGAAGGLLAGNVFWSASSEAWALACLVGSAASALVYRRFGYQYAAVGAMCAAAVLPLAFNSLAVEQKRIIAALVCAVTYAYASLRKRRATDDVGRADAEVIRAAAASTVYLALNVYILTDAFGRYAPDRFRWGTWLVTWLMPFALGRVAIVDRDPLLLRVAIATGLASLLTNKAYLGWTHQPWDPMLLGIVLMGGALLLRRWLAAGEGAERRGFTARQIVESEGAALQLASLASVAVQPAPTRHPHQPTDSSFSGGRSGGGGAGGEF